MYTLICLADLENDFINPHDSANRINKFVTPEYVLQAIHFLLFVVGAKWSLVVISFPVVAWLVRAYLKGQALVDVTEIFNNLPMEKKVRLTKLFAHLMMFIIIIYRVVEATVTALMASHGPAISHTIISNIARAAL
eukprot:CAMPEP_0118926030 /NCGR_PEP_ID=MMETSP1169-20130426/3825_1 /TAXON_ID=36882 /ORGANISM="Pyramimonas obovata, Strain CCMP722" /LENGTH=135 /DNA_ID=CAMNT_0006867493 /DNA_START=326 /DNA_END=733 /DNA_ORIENTATION=-